MGGWDGVAAAATVSSSLEVCNTLRERKEDGAGLLPAPGTCTPPDLPLGRMRAFREPGFYPGIKFYGPR